MAAERVRVVHVITRMILGGAQEDALLTLEGLRDSGAYEVGLVTGPETGTEGELLSRACAVGIPVHIVRPMRRRVRPLLDLLAAAEIRRVLDEVRPTIVQSHSSKAGVLTRWAARRAGVPVVVHRIHGLAFHPFGGRMANAVFRSAERFAAPRADRLISVADCLTRTCLEAGVGREEQFVTIPTGIETAPYLNTPPGVRARVRRELGFDKNDIVFVKVARLFELKGHEFVLEAASDVLNAVPRAKFLFVGGGPRRDELEREARSLPPGTVRFTGLVPPDRIPGLLAASDCLVHSSLREGLPRVLVQAHFAGLPVVSFDLDGAPEIVEDGRTGRLIPARDVGALSAAMVEMGLDGEKRAAFGELGRERALERFSAKALVHSTDRLYRELLAEKRLPLPPPLGGTPGSD
ncbi:MAG: glycosyltransferase family 4 protein [Planctomycetota bacterium]